MANSSQLLKGILEGCILKIISKKETYGYELYNSLKTNINQFVCPQYGYIEFYAEEPKKFY